MDFYRPASIFCHYQGNTTHKSCCSVDSFADSSVAGDFSVFAVTRVGLGLRIAPDARSGSQRRILKTEWQNTFFSIPAFRALTWASNDLNSLSSDRAVYKCRWKSSVWVLGPLQLEKTNVFMREYQGFKVDMPWWSSLLKLHCPAPRSRRVRQSVCVNLAAIQPGTESATTVDDRENESKWRHEKEKRGSKRKADDKWNIESDEELLRLIQESRDFYPIVRAYKNDLCTLEICGSALRSQVLAAMASDQSFTAATNILMGRGLTVLQTVLPGSSGEHSTVSTKLFAPSLLVVEKARRFSPPNGVSGREFMRKLFEAVQLQRLSKFYVELHAPGTVRDMGALKQEEMVQTAFSFESSNKRVLEQMGKAISLYAIASIKENAGGGTHSGLFGKVKHKSKWIPSSQAPVRIRMLSVEEIQSCIKMLSESIHLSESVPTDRRADHSWWPTPVSLMVLIRGFLDSATEPWIHEHVPMHQLHLDLSVLEAKVTGGCTSPGQVEVLLTHAQLVDFAGVLDQYYEDRFTLLDKSLQIGAVLDLQHVSRSKLAKFLETAAISSFIVGAGFFAWLVAARLGGPSGILNDKLRSKSIVLMGPALAKESLQTVIRNEPMLPVNKQLSVKEMDVLCELAVIKIAKAFNWEGHIQSSVGKGAWMGNHNAEAKSLPNENQPETLSEDSSVKVVESEITVPETRMDKLPSSECEDNGHESFADNQKVPLRTVQGRKGPLLYQVVLSRDGNVYGFQPLNREAVSLWALMPFAELLHKGQKLGPGFWEPQLKYSKPPMDAVVLELCILIDPFAPFVSARPFPM